MDKRSLRRLSQEDRSLIMRLTNEGKSLRDISKSMEIGVTTVYYHVRKFKPKMKKTFSISLSEEKIGELVGAFAGDGSYYYSSNNKKDKTRGGQHRIRYHLSLKSDREYAIYIKDLLTKLNLNPHLIPREDNNTIDVSISSLDYTNFIRKFLYWDKKKTPSVCLNKNLNEYTEDFRLGFARGLMDTDGYVEVSNVSCCCISKGLMDNLAEILDTLGINYKRTVKKRPLRKNIFLIRVSRSSLDRYKEKIGFSNRYKLRKLNKILRKG